MKKKWILTALLGVLLTGCGNKVITVADISSEDGGETQYIEMQEFELKEQIPESSREEVSYCAVLIPASYQACGGGNPASVSLSDYAVSYREGSRNAFGSAGERKGDPAKRRNGNGEDRPGAICNGHGGGPDSR